jgi:hypothetical protein
MFLPLRSVAIAVLLGGVASAQDAGFGVVSGQVRYGGEAPKAAVLDLKNHGDTKACEKNGKVPDEDLIVNPKNKGVRNLFVWIEPADKTVKLPIEPKFATTPSDKIEIDQPACAFTPHVVAIREGQILVAKNSSSLAHNFAWSGNPDDNPGGNRLVPPGQPFEIELKASKQPITGSCSIHPWMKMYIRVFKHPSFAVTDADGKFKIPTAPVGDWRLKIAEGNGRYLGGAAGKTGQPVTVKAGDNDVGTIEFPPEKK